MARACACLEVLPSFDRNRGTLSATNTKLLSPQTVCLNGSTSLCFEPTSRPYCTIAVQSLRIHHDNTIAGALNLECNVESRPVGQRRASSWKPIQCALNHSDHHNRIAHSSVCTRPTGVPPLLSTANLPQPTDPRSIAPRAMAATTD
jgi:hypothetical protein